MIRNRDDAEAVDKWTAGLIERPSEAAKVPPHLRSPVYRKLHDVLAMSVMAPMTVAGRQFDGRHVEQIDAALTAIMPVIASGLLNNFLNFAATRAGNPDREKIARAVTVTAGQVRVEFEKMITEKPGPTTVRFIREQIAVLPSDSKTPITPSEDGVNQYDSDWEAWRWELVGAE